MLVAENNRSDLNQETAVFLTQVENFSDSGKYVSETGKRLFPDLGYYNYFNLLIFFSSVKREI